MSTKAVADRWWSNWPQTFGYVPQRTYFPETVDELSTIVRNDPGPLKAVGGGWSFNEASLPMATAADVTRASIAQNAVTQVTNWPNLRDMASQTISMDATPFVLGAMVQAGSSYNSTTSTQSLNPASAAIPPVLTTPPPDLTGTFGQLSGMLATRSVAIVDTNLLASSLQEGWPALAAGAPAAPNAYFHVEAGIAIRDLYQLLDHQKPRLALGSSGGSPGATLAGAISTGTHGGEFSTPLLVDTVRAIHLVGPGGVQWWIEGSSPIANPQALMQRYPNLKPTNIIAGAWSQNGLTPQDVLDAVVVSMGTMGVIYSVVLEVIPQYGIEQHVARSTWDGVLTKATPSYLRNKLPADPPTIAAGLAQGSATANRAMLGVILDGSLTGLGGTHGPNVYADLAVNPLNHDAWITNRKVVPVPYDPDSPGSQVGAYFTAVVNELKAVSQGTVFGIHGSEPVGTLFDLLGYDKNVLFALKDVNELGTLVKWVARWPDLLTSMLATIAAQTQAPGHTGTQRREIIAAAVMSGLLNGIQSTPQPSGPPQVAVTAAVSYQVGAVGWPDSGIPGTALEIALHPDVAFTFIQNQLLNGVFAPNQRTQHLLLGYLSVRVCQPTRTLMGMQQFAPYSVMVELVGYRSPEAVAAMKAIQDAVLNWNANQPSVSTAAMLHWGLENDRLSAASLLRTPLGGPAPGAAGNPPPTKVDRFRAVRSLLAAGSPSSFDNAFVARLGL